MHKILYLIELTKHLFLLKSENGKDCYLIPVEFLEKINSQNKVLYKNQLQHAKQLDEIKNLLSKIHKEDNLTPAFFEVNIKFIAF